jgi:glycosyltransferase involved in cell wall biosynthesis
MLRCCDAAQDDLHGLEAARATNPASIRVRILIDYRPALRQRSGVGEYIVRLLHALVSVKAPGDQLAIFSSSWKDRVERRDLERGVEVIDRRIPVRVLNRLWYQREWPVIEQLAGGFDVVHAATPVLIPARRAAQVVTVYDLDFLSHPEWTWAEMRRDYGRLVQQHTLRADHVIVISAFTAGEVHQRLGVPMSRITVCRPGAPPWTPRATAPAPGEGYILFVGTLEPRKNVGGLLEAYSQLVQRRPDAPRLILAGREIPFSKPWLEAIARPPLSGKATHLGYVADHEREALYKGASLVVLPSFNEGFGLPVLEAMTVGVPVIAAARGALPEVLGDAGLLVDPDDPEALSAAMERMLTDSTLARVSAASGVRRTRLFDWTSSAQALRGAYDEAASFRAQRRPGGQPGGQPGLALDRR